MIRFLKALLFSAPFALAAGDFPQSQRVQIIGQTDFTQIGNISDRLKVDLGGQNAQMINRTDVSTTVTSTGTSETFDSQGLPTISFNWNISAISGSGATIQFHAEMSDDNSNWKRFLDAPRQTATGLVTFDSYKISKRYYRIAWDVSGSSPSVTFTSIETLKAYSSIQKAQRFFYADVSLTTIGNASTTFDADNCHNVGVVMIRGADGGNNSTVQLFAGNDDARWTSVSGNLAANVNTTNVGSVSQVPWRYYHIQVTAASNAGTRTLDLQWSCN